MTTEEAKKLGRDLTDEELSNLVLTPEETIKCELDIIKGTAESLLDLDAGRFAAVLGNIPIGDLRDGMSHDILLAVERTKESLSELTGKNLGSANA